MSNLHEDSIIIDGLNISKFDRSVFEDMRKGGVTAVNCTVSVWESFEKTVDNMRQSVMDIRRAKALLAALPEVDPDRIAITGVSLGGIMTSLAAGVDGTFYRVVPILAGGDLAAITFHARETRKIREACEAKGITQEKLAEMLQPVDPLTFASRIKPATCLMINAALDEVIPAETTAALRKAIGMPQQLIVPGVGHYKAGLFLPTIRQRVIEYISGKKVEKL